MCSFGISNFPLKSAQFGNEKFATDKQAFKGLRQFVRTDLARNVYSDGNR